MLFNNNHSKLIHFMTICNGNSTLSCCFTDNINITIPFILILSFSLIFNFVSCSFWVKFKRERTRRKKRIEAVRLARNKKKQKYSEKNLEYQVFAKKNKTTIPEWAYNQFMEDMII